MGRDPIKEKGGLNLYAFCRNDSINLWDYLGMDPTFDPKTGGWVLAGGSATNPLGVVGHYFVGTQMPTGQIQILDYGANRISGGNVPNIAALVVPSASHADPRNFNTVIEFNDWATKNGYSVFATLANASQLDAANNAMASIIANPPDYQALQIGGESCVSACSQVLSAAGIQTPAETSAKQMSDNVKLGGEPYFSGVITGAQALFYTALTPGFAPVAAGSFKGPVEPGVVTLGKFVVTASKIKTVSSGAAGSSGGGVPSAIQIAGGVVITDPGMIAELLASLGSDPVNTSLDGKKKIEEENER